MDSAAEGLRRETERAIVVLTAELPDAVSCLDEGFLLLAQTRARLREASGLASGNAARFLVCAGEALSRCERLCLAQYWLFLAGLGCEARGLQRVLLEGIEALQWLAADPERITEVQFECDPKSGQRAKAIGSPYHKARRQLSEEAAHFGLSAKSADDEHDSTAGFERLRNGLRRVFCDQCALLVQGVSCLAAAGEPNHDLADRSEEFMHRGFERQHVVAIASFGVPNGASDQERALHAYREPWPSILRYPPIPTE